MDQKIKNILGAVVILAVLAAGYSVVSYVNSYGKSITPSSFRSFSVTGEGKITAIPDIAQFNFTVISEGGKEDLNSLQTKNAESANKAIAFVKSKGVEDKDIKTSYYNVTPRYQTYNCKPDIYSPLSSVEPCPPPSIVGYTVTQSVNVKIRDFAKIGDIMAGVVDNGANQVGDFVFSIDDPEKVQNEARAQATAKAKEKAKSVAKEGGFRVGRLISINEGYNPRYDYYALPAGMGGGVESKSPAPVIEPGSQEITVAVTMQYEIR